MTRNRKDSANSIDSFSKTFTLINSLRSKSGASIGTSTDAENFRNKQSGVDSSNRASQTMKDTLQVSEERRVHAEKIYNSLNSHKIKSLNLDTSKGSRETVARLRELIFRIKTKEFSNHNFFEIAADLLEKYKSRDKDWDRKVVRILHFYLRALVYSNIKISDLEKAAEIVENETKHNFLPRKVVALQTLSIISEKLHKFESKGEIYKSIKCALLEPFESREKLKCSNEKRIKKNNACQKEISLLSRGMMSAFRRCPETRNDVGLLDLIIKNCCSGSKVTARHSFAVLVSQSKTNPKLVSDAIFPLLQPTTVATACDSFSPNLPNLGDTLGCVYYLQTLKNLVFSNELDSQSRLDFYRIIANSVSDSRQRVALEAMHCLMDHERAWAFLLCAQRESRDLNIFRRVVDTLMNFLSASNVSSSSKMKQASESPNWPLAHAACRTARGMGRTLQKAISFESFELGMGKSASELVHFSSNLSDKMTCAKNSGDPEKSNQAAIRDLCRAIWEQGFMDCDHSHVKSLALEAMFLLIPDPSSNDVELRDMWAELKSKIEACPSRLLEPDLKTLCACLIDRIECSSMTGREAIVSTVLSIIESFCKQVPTDSVMGALVQAWTKCVKYGPECSKIVLASVNRVLDGAHKWEGKRFDMNSAERRKKQKEMCSNVFGFEDNQKRDFSSFRDSYDLSMSYNIEVEENCGFFKNLGCSAFWFLGKYCMELIGYFEPESGSFDKNRSLTLEQKQIARKMIIKVKNAVLWDDDSTRLASTSALCNMALFFPNPMKLDVYMFLRALVRGESWAALDQEYKSLDTMICECSGMLQLRPMFGLSEFVLPVLDQLDSYFEKIGPTPKIFS